jgi:hypothetical protein
MKPSTASWTCRNLDHYDRYIFTNQSNITTLHLPHNPTPPSHNNIIAPATTASMPSLTTTAFAAPVFAAADEEAATADPV